jgi:hypothetical protein
MIYLKEGKRDQSSSFDPESLIQPIIKLSKPTKNIFQTFFYLICLKLE